MSKKSATPSLFPESRGTLHLGPYFPALEEAFLAAVRDRRDALDPIWVLAPTGEMQRRLRSRLASSGGALAVHFFSFESLAEELSSLAAGKLGLSPLPSGGDFLLMEEILREVDLGYFAPARHEARFSGTLLSTLRDLRDAGVAPQALHRAAQAKLGAGDKLASLAAIAEAWEKRLAKLQLYDRSDAFRLAAQEVKEGRAPLPAPFTLLVYGVADFTGVQRRLLEALASRAQVLHAFVPPEQEFSKRAIAFFRGLGLVEKISPGASAGSSASTSPEPRRISAAGRAEEVRECLREVLVLLESGMPPAEIGIVSRNRESYQSLLNDAFAAAQIPLAPATRPSLAQSESGKALLLGIRLRQAALTRRVLFSWLQLPALDLAALTGIADPPLVEWDRLLRDAGTVHFEKGWEKRVPVEAASALRQALASLRAIQTSGAPRDLAASLAAFAGKALREGEEKDHLLEALSKLGVLDCVRQRIEAEELSTLVEEALENARDGNRPAGIFFGDAMQARGLSFRALFLLGLAAKEFPRPPLFDPVLLDGEREALAARFGAADLQPKGRAKHEEEFLFEGLQASAREQLCFLRPRLDPVKGKEILPSPFWGDPKGEEKAPLRFWSASSRGTAASLLEFDLRQTDALARIDRDLAGKYLAEQFPQTAALGLVLEEQRWSPGRYTIFDGGVGAQAAGLLPGLRFDGAISPTKLESLAGCPFRFFLESGLEVAPLEEPESESTMDSRDRGTLVHKVLAALLKDLPQGKTLDQIPQGQLAARCRELFAACWAQAEREGLPGVWADREAMRQQLLAQLLAYLDEEIEKKSPVPLHLEWELPGGIEFRAGQFAFPLRGRVDRIDSVPGGAGRVVDFKSGARPEGGVGTLQGGRRIQVPLYSYAVERALGLHPIAGEYHYLGDGKRAELNHDGDSPELRQAVEILLSLGKSGLFPQIPKYCHNCQVKLACPSEPDAILARKQSDPRVKDFLALHGGELEPKKEKKAKKSKFGGKA